MSNSPEDRPERGGYRREDRRDDRAGGPRRDDRGGYGQRRDDRPREDRPRYDRPREDRQGGGFRRDDERGGFRRDDRRDARSYGPRRDDDRGGFRRDDRRDERPRYDRPREDRGSHDRGSHDRGGFRRDDRPGGGFRRDDRPRFDRPREDRQGGGFRRDDDRGGFRRDDRRDARSYGPRRDDDRGGFRRDDRRDERPRYDRPREDRGSHDRGGFRRDDRPGGGFRRDDRPRYDRPRDDRPGGGFRRDDRPREERPRDDRPRYDRPRDDRSAGGFRRDDRRDERPRYDRPRDDRPGGGFRRDDRPRDDRRDDRPRGPRRDGDRGGFRRDDRRDERPRYDRPRGDGERDRGPSRRPAVQGRGRFENRSVRDERRDDREPIKRLPIPDEVTGQEIDPSVRQELMSLPKTLAEDVARNLVMVARLLDEEPERAYAYSRVALRLASRVAAVREAAGFASYATERYTEALAEFRATRRMTGTVDLWPVMADCERGLGRPERALDMAGAPEVQKLDKAGQVEMRLVAAGARQDLGQAEAAVVTLQSSELASHAIHPWTARLRYAYADALLAVGRENEAREWFAKALEADHDGTTDASDRLALLDGVSFVDAFDEETADEADTASADPRDHGTDADDDADAEDRDDPDASDDADDADEDDAEDDADDAQQRPEALAHADETVDPTDAAPAPAPSFLESPFREPKTAERDQDED